MEVNIKKVAFLKRHFTFRVLYMSMDISTLFIYLYLSKYLRWSHVICHACTANFTVERLQLILQVKLLKPLKQNPWIIVG